MVRLNKIVLGIVFMFSSQTFAAEWKFFAESSGIKQYLDIDSFQVNDIDNTVSFWEKRVGILEIDKGFKAGKIVSLDKFYCDKKTYQFMEMHIYDKNGHLMKSVFDPSFMIRIVPDSISEHMLKTACEDTRN